MTPVELKVLRCELVERIGVLKERAERSGRAGRWNVRKELREQCHRAEVRLAEVDRRLRALEVD